MTPEEFQAFVNAIQEKHGISKLRLAAALGCQKDSIKRWEERGAPFYINLAAAALMAGLDPFSKTA
jgi:hypothetical protein